MKLSTLIEGLGIERSSAGITANPDILELSDDSRRIRQGTLFIALKGVRSDGASFIASAIEQGASAVLTADKIAAIPPKVAHCVHPSPENILTALAERFYTELPTRLAAVTGTDGKSSVADFTRQLWEVAGHKAASLGTLGVCGDAVPPPLQGSLGNTTPGVIKLYDRLAALRQAGIDHAVMEASSHGLSLGRVGTLQYQAAAFTNLSRDHLDFHGDMESYFEAKTLLFTRHLAKGGVAMICADDAYGLKLLNICRDAGISALGYGASEEAGWRIVEANALPNGIEARLSLQGKEVALSLPLIGKFQLYNCLAAMGLAVGCGMSLEQALKGAGKLRTVDGRLEHAATLPGGGAVYIDYAHTPRALEQVLKAVREHVQGRLVVVFGCGGDRDRGKRPLMGEIAGRLADVAILTDDNPRTEDAASIRAEIRAGMAASANWQEIPGRREAITEAIITASPGDVILLAGKGHEREQIIGTILHPFDEREVIKQALLTGEKV